MHRTALSSVLLLLPTACGPDVPDPIWTGDHLVYSATTDGPVCRGSFYRQEQHAVEMAQLLGVELTEAIHYTRVADRDELAEYCEGLKGKGCAYVDKPYVFGIRTFNFHEITHAVAHLGGIHGALPFEEGFAEVFSDGGDADVEAVPLDEALQSFTLDDKFYRTMGLFVRFLIERHSLDQLVDFLRSTARDAPFAEFSPIFEDIFGEPLETAMTDFEEYPSCSDMSNRIALLDCNLPLQPWDGKTVSLTANVSCDQDDVLGPASDDVMFSTRGFEVLTQGSYLFLASAPDGWSGIRVVKCGSCWDSFDAQIEPGAMATHELSPGRYYVLFGRSADKPAELGLAIGQL